MSSKQSCFKSIIKCDLKRSWWIGALAALFIFMTSTSPLFSYANRYDFYSYPRYDGILDFCQMMFGNYAIGMGVSAFVVLYLFSYINKVNSVSFFHSLPSTRNTLMLSHILSSSVIIAVPMLINVIISLFAVGRGVKASWILMSFAMYLIYSFVIFSLTLVVSMLTGVSIASGIFTVVVALLPLFVFAFVSELCHTYLFGYAGSKALEDFLLNYVYLSPESLMSPKVIIYIILIALLVVISFLIYKKRHLENYGEVIAFPELKGLFEVLFALCSGVLGYYYFEAFWSITSILTMLVFGTIGVIVAHMIANRSLGLKGVLKPLVATVGVILLIFVVFFFDIIGFETRIPDADDIEYATIGGIYYSDYTYVDSNINGQGRVKVTRKEQYQPNYTSREDINNFLKLHKYAVDHRKENEDCDDDFFISNYRITERSHIEVNYKLKNGKVMTRSYSLPKDELDKLTYDIYNSEVYKKWKYPVIDGTPKIYKRVEIFDNRNYDSNEGKILYASNDDAKNIIQALEKDKKLLPYEVMRIKNSGSHINVNLYYTMTYVSQDGEEYQVEHSDSYNIDEYDVNTWALLKKLDYFSETRKIELEDVKSVGVNVENYYVAEDLEYIDDEEYFTASAVNIERTVASSSVKYSDIKYAGEYRSFTEKEDIEVLYNLFMTHQNRVIEKEENFVTLYIELDLNGNITKSRKILIAVDELPDVLEYIKKTYMYM